MVIEGSGGCGNKAGCGVILMLAVLLEEDGTAGVKAMLEGQRLHPFRAFVDACPIQRWSHTLAAMPKMGFIDKWRKK